MVFKYKPSLMRLTLSIALILSSFVFDVICFTPPERFAQTSALIGGKIYYMGGFAPPPAPTISDFFYLDTSLLNSTDSATLPWTELTGLTPPLNVTFGTAVAGGANKDLFVLFGGQMIPFDNSVIVYDTKNSTWSRPAILTPQGEPPRRKQTQAVIDSAGKMYVFGGFIESGDDLLNDIFILDTINWSWSTGSQEGAPEARGDFSATILNNGVIVYIGGTNVNNRYVPMGQINTYNTVSAVWANTQATGDAPSPRGGHSAVLKSSGLIIIYGGAVSISADGQFTAASPDIAVLDTTNNNFVWSQPKASGTPPPSVAYHSATLVGDYMVVSFGNIIGKGPSSGVYVLNTKDNNDYKWITSISPDAPVTPDTPVPNAPGAPDTSTSDSTSSNNSSSNVGVIVGITVGGVAGLLLLGVGLFLFYRYRNKKMMEGVIETPGEFTDAGFTRRYETMNSATTSQTSHDYRTSTNIESDPSREFHPSYSNNFPIKHDPEAEGDDDDKEFRILPQELQPEYLEKKFNNNDNDDI